AMSSNLPQTKMRRRSVSWAKLWAKAKQNSAQNKSIVRRGNSFMIFFIIGSMCTLAAGIDSYSVVRHQILGSPATATVMERSTQCTVEYQFFNSYDRRCDDRTIRKVLLIDTRRWLHLGMRAILYPSKKSIRKTWSDISQEFVC